MLWQDVVPPRDLRLHRARRKRLGNYPGLFFIAPAPTPPNPRPDLHPARPNLVVYMVKHICKTIPYLAGDLRQETLGLQCGGSTPLSIGQPYLYASADQRVRYLTYQNLIREKL